MGKPEKGAAPRDLLQVESNVTAFYLLPRDLIPRYSDAWLAKASPEILHPGGKNTAAVQMTDQQHYAVLQDY